MIGYIRIKPNSPYYYAVVKWKDVDKNGTEKKLVPKFLSRGIINAELKNIVMN